MSESSRDERRLVVRITTAFVVGVVILWGLYSIRGALLIIYVSGLLAIGFTPPVRWLERQHFVGQGRMPRWAAILVLYFGVVAIASLVLALAIPPIVSQSVGLWHELPVYVVRIERAFERHGLLRQGWTLNDLLSVMPEPGTAVTAVFGALQSVIGTIGAMVAILVLPYYLLVDTDALRDGLLQLFPSERRGLVSRMTQNATAKVGAWLHGQLLLAFAIGVSASIGLWLMGVPYFYVLGLIAAAGEFVPIVGPIVAAIPAVLVASSVSWHTTVFVIAYFSVQQFVEGNILVPRLMQRQVGVSAWFVIVALLIGSELLGVAGAILAVPTAAIVQVLFQEYLNGDPAA